MFNVSVKETYQKTILSPVRLNFDLGRYLRTMEEVEDNVRFIEQELDRMNIIQTKTRKTKNSVEKRIEYQRPGKLGTLIRTITITKYNPPREASLI